MAILNNSNAISAAGGYDVNNSLRFRQSASARLSRTPGTAGNRKTWTFSAWIKISTLTPGGVQQGLFSARSTSTDQMTIFYQNEKIYFQSGGSKGDINTNAVLRDVSAWYHLVVVLDATNATTADKAIIYLNGTRQSVTTTTSFTNADHGINATIAHNIGAEAFTNTLFFDGYMAEVNFIDGSAKTPSDFGATDATTGVWKPKAYTGTYGTNGFYLKFSDIATTSGSNAGLGKDFSGNTNYWNTNNISVTSGATYDAMTDSPTNTSATVANYAVLNYIDSNTAANISGANLNWTSPGIDREIRGTIGVSSGKYYWEVVVTSGNTAHVGVDTLNTAILNDYVGSTSTSWGLNLSNGNKRNAGSSVTYGSSFANNDIMMCALDMDNSKIWWGKNGTWFASGDPAAGTNAAFTNLSGYTLAFACTPRNSSSVNFGQRPFAYTPPTGFNRLNTYNLPDSTIKKGNSYMDATTYTGNGTSQTITNAASFRPDLVWIKGRSYADFHTWFDTVRGATLSLSSNLTTAEVTRTTALTAFTSTGFTVSSDTLVNFNANTLVAWQWQAGSSTVTNTSGSISSQVRANTTTGFSIVTWTGTGTPGTVGHGLGVAPKVVISKKRNGTSDWAFWITGFAGTELMEMNATSAKFTGTTVWNSTTPTSTVFSVGSATQTNNSGGTYVAYLWSEISGFSKFGSYTGNGSTDGVFVFTGFRPKYLMVKSSSAVGNWVIVDTSRNTFNVTNLSLDANNADAEQTGTSSTMPTMDLLSNGFKLRTTSAGGNGNGVTYIYMAFAENPFKNANAR
jgi:hypothetical protein